MTDIIRRRRKLTARKSVMLSAPSCSFRTAALANSASKCITHRGVVAIFRSLYQHNFSGRREIYLHQVPLFRSFFHQQCFAHRRQRVEEVPALLVILVHQFLIIKVCYPFWKFSHIIIRSDPASCCIIIPVSSIGIVTGRRDTTPVFNRNTNHLTVIIGSNFQFITHSRGQHISRPILPREDLVPTVFTVLSSVQYTERFRSLSHQSSCNTINGGNWTGVDAAVPAGSISRCIWDQGCFHSYSRYSAVFWIHLREGTCHNIGTGNPSASGLSQFLPSFGRVTGACAFA